MKAFVTRLRLLFAPVGVLEVVVRRMVRDELRRIGLERAGSTPDVRVIDRAAS